MTHSLAAPDLWTAARAMLAELFFIVGAATAAHLKRLTRRERIKAREWLTALEAMVRKVLLIEARALGLLGPPAPSPARARALCLSARVRRPPAFSLLPEDERTHAHPARVRRLGPPLLVADLWRNAARARAIAALRSAPRPGPQAHLVNRIAALARVVAAPLSAIRRLARLLRRRLAIGCAIAFARTKIPFTFPGDANRATHERAVIALMALNSS